MNDMRRTSYFASSRGTSAASDAAIQINILDCFGFLQKPRNDGYTKGASYGNKSFK